MLGMCAFACAAILLCPVCVLWRGTNKAFAASEQHVTINLVSAAVVDCGARGL
jgi:hypothetical protein